MTRMDSFRFDVKWFADATRFMTFEEKGLFVDLVAQFMSSDGEIAPGWEAGVKNFCADSVVDRVMSAFLRASPEIKKLVDKHKQRIETNRRCASLRWAERSNPNPVANPSADKPQESKPKRKVAVKLPYASLPFSWFSLTRERFPCHSPFVIFAEFRNYWISDRAVGGGKKSDWKTTWVNWLRKIPTDHKNIPVDVRYRIGANPGEVRRMFIDSYRDEPGAEEFYKNWVGMDFDGNPVKNEDPISDDLFSDNSEDDAMDVIRGMV